MNSENTTADSMQRTGCPYPKPPRSKMDWIEWIDAKEKLPEIGVFCLASSKERKIGVFVGYLEDDEVWKFYIGTEGRTVDIDTVSHWMPLPEPPK